MLIIARLNGQFLKAPFVESIAHNYRDLLMFILIIIVTSWNYVVVVILVIGRVASYSVPDTNIVCGCLKVFLFFTVKNSGYAFLTRERCFMAFLVVREFRVAIAIISF